MALQESDIEFQDIPIHIWEGGEGYPILVLLGFGTWSHAGVIAHSPVG